MEDLKIYTIDELSDLKKGTSEGVKRGWEKRRLRSKYDSQRNQMSPEEMKIPLDPPFTKGNNYPSLWSPTQPPAQKSLWLGESGL